MPGNRRLPDGGGEADQRSFASCFACDMIHTVGPIWWGGEEGERQLLETCYRSCLVIAHTEQFPQIAFAAIATGIYGFPREEAARIAATTVVEHLAERDFPKRVICVCFDPATFQAYQKALGREA